jgi:hypothetical protein
MGPDTEVASWTMGQRASMRGVVEMGKYLKDAGIKDRFGNS